MDLTGYSYDRAETYPLANALDLETYVHLVHLAHLVPSFHLETSVAVDSFSQRVQMETKMKQSKIPVTTDDPSFHFL